MELKKVAIKIKQKMKRSFWYDLIYGFSFKNRLYSYFLKKKTLHE